MPSKIRLQQIAERIREELSEMLIREVADPRLSGISVTDVKVDRELAWADIFVSAIEGQVRSKEVLEGLRSATGFLRRELTLRIDLRVFPRLRFHWDPTPERAEHIERMLDSLREEEANRPPRVETSDGDGVPGDPARDEEQEDDA
jgi:ribosome-binding factor A